MTPTLTKSKNLQSTYLQILMIDDERTIVIGLQPIKIKDKCNNNNMADLNLPTLSLFNRTPCRTKRQLYPRDGSYENSLFEVLKESNRIQNQVHIPSLPYPSPSLYEHKYRQIRNEIELDYLNSNYGGFGREPVSLSSTQRGDVGHSFRAKPTSVSRPRTICECQEPHIQSRCPEVILMKNPYLNHKNPPPPKQKDEIDFNRMPDKSAYLSVKDNASKPKPPQPREEADKSIILNINASMMGKNPGSEMNKMINDSKFLNTNQSILIEDASPPKRELRSQQVQTEEPAINRSSFLIEKVVKRVPQMMNQQNFQKAIKNLSNEINNIKLQLDTEDIIIDLSDLVMTKDQYLDESKTLLSTLNFLSEGKTEGGMTKSKTGKGMVWPHGV